MPSYQLTLWSLVKKKVANQTSAKKMMSVPGANQTSQYSIVHTPDSAISVVRLFPGYGNFSVNKSDIPFTAITPRPTAELLNLTLVKHGKVLARLRLVSERQNFVKSSPLGKRLGTIFFT